MKRARAPPLQRNHWNINAFAEALNFAWNLSWWPRIRPRSWHEQKTTKLAICRFGRPHQEIQFSNKVLRRLISHFSRTPKLIVLGFFQKYAVRAKPMKSFTLPSFPHPCEAKKNLAKNLTIFCFRSYRRKWTKNSKKAWFFASDAISYNWSYISPVKSPDKSSHN